MVRSLPVLVPLVVACAACTSQQQLGKPEADSQSTVVVEAAATVGVEVRDDEASGLHDAVEGEDYGRASLDRSQQAEAPAASGDAFARAPSDGAVAGEADGDAVTGVASATEKQRKPRFPSKSRRLPTRSGYAAIALQDAQEYERNAAVAPVVTSDEACAPGEVAQGYDPGTEASELCVPTTLAEACRRQGHLPVIVSDFGMDCAVPEVQASEPEDVDAALAVDLPACGEDGIVSLFPGADEDGGGFDCRPLESFDGSTQRALAASACGDLEIVVKVVAGSDFDEAIRGVVSCL